MDRRKQLEALANHLSQLVEILEREDNAWQRPFRRFLSETQALLKDGFDQQNLNNLSAAIMHVYGGSGSFNDRYFGECDVEVIGEQVFEDALSLRVTGTRN